MMHVHNIIWDDGNKELPKNVVLPDDVSVEDAADYLSNEYGFCVLSLEVGAWLVLVHDAREDT